MMEIDTLVFYVNGVKVTEAHPETDATLLQYLRRKLLLTGTKEGCGHGGCGSCTIMVSRFDTLAQKAVHYTVNACLFPLPAVHGLAVTTVEGVGSPNTGLHDIQKRLIESHGLQCGFCTPGFVMSAFTLLRNHPQPSGQQVERALEGNLCRCTGYRPILSALDTFTKEGCPMGDQCCKKGNQSEVPDPASGEQLCPAVKESTQVPIFPPELQLNDKLLTKTVTFTGAKWQWVRPVDLAGLLAVKSEHPQAPVIMGNTTAALEIKLGKFNNSPVLIYGAGILDLHKVEVNTDGVKVGSAVTMTELQTHLSEIALQLEDSQKPHILSLLNMIGHYGADQIRNVATVGGSLLCGRSNSDVATLLIALDAKVTVHSATTGVSRSVPLDGLTIGPGEVMTFVTVPFSTERSYSCFYKSKERRTFSLAIINSGMCVRLSPKDKVEELRLCFGGVRKTAQLMIKSSSQAEGRLWDHALLQETISCLTEELTQNPGVEEGNYKSSVATAFFFKFFHTISAKLIGAVENDKLLAPLTKQPLESTQFFDPCTEPNQSESDAVGRPVPNVSSEAVVSGEAVYTDDMPRMEGELFLCHVLSRKARARLVNVDPSEALKLPGVHSYIDHTDIQGVNCFDEAEEVFASKEVFWVGQTIGAILAETREIARKASYLVKVTYEQLPAILTIQDAIKAGSYTGEVQTIVTGDVEAAFKSSDIIVEGEFSNGHQEHFYMEPMCAMAIPRIENDEIEVYCCSQFIHLSQTNISSVVKVPLNKLTCKVRRLGGSFGGKESRSLLLAIPVTVAALKYKRPVRCVLPREVDMEITGKRHPYYSRYKLGCKKDGTIQAYQVQAYNNGGWTPHSSRFVMWLFLDYMEQAYKIPHISAEGYVCKTNLPTNTAFRGFGAPQACQLIEEAIYNVAETLGMSPEQVREKNLFQKGDTTVHGAILEDCTVRELWSRCKADSQFKSQLEDVKAFNRENKFKKRGIAMTAVKYGVGLPMKILHQASALVNIYTDGTVLVNHQGVEMGQGINTKMLQIASRALDVPMDKLYTSETGTNTCPQPGPTGGSTGTDLHGPAVLDACNILSERLKPFREQNPGLSWEELIGVAFMNRAKLTATGFSRREKTFDFDESKNSPSRFDHYTYGVACSMVEIDALTGENQVLQTDIMFDVGKSLNPGIDIGQIEGGFIQGLGMVTSEQIEVDHTGRMQNCSPLSYKIPNVTSLPRKFKVTLLKNHDHVTNVYSSKGIGEPPLLLSVSVLMAIKEAVKAARGQIGLQGRFQLDSPATVQRIREACGDQMKLLQKI